MRELISEVVFVQAMQQSGMDPDIAADTADVVVDALLTMRGYLPYSRSPHSDVVMKGYLIDETFIPVRCVSCSHDRSFDDVRDELMSLVDVDKDVVRVIVDAAIDTVMWDDGLPVTVEASSYDATEQRAVH